MANRTRSGRLQVPSSEPRFAGLVRVGQAVGVPPTVAELLERLGVDAGDVTATELLQLNAAIHRIAVTQARCHDGARALLLRRGETEHETHKASRRVLKRHLSDVVYRALTAGAWRLDQPTQQAA